MLGVVYDVQEDLLELVRVGDGDGKGWGEVGLHGDVVDSEFVVAEFKRRADEVVNGDGSLLWLCGPREGEEVLYDSGCSLGLGIDFLQGGAAVFIYVFAEEEFGVAHNTGEGIIEFVGNAGDELADGCHFGGLE